MRARVRRRQIPEIRQLTGIRAGSAPDVDLTLTSRKTPRLPPPRQSTPKHTNIGSPKRMSTGRPISQRLSTGLEADGSPARVSRTQPPPNRVLDFGANEVLRSIESPSPFKPKHRLRRSVGPRPSNPFASPENATTSVHTLAEVEEEEAEAGAQDDVELPEPVDDGPLILDDNEYDAKLYQPAEEAKGVHVEDVHESLIKRKPGRPRKSGDSVNSNQIQHSPSGAGMAVSKKRDRSVLENDQSEDDVGLSQSQVSESAPSQKRKRVRPSKGDNVIVLQDDEDAAIDPALLAHGDVDITEDVADAGSEPPGKSKGKSRKGKAPKERDANRAMRATGSPVKLNDSPSKLRQSRAGSRSVSIGPISNVLLRATTPFEDAGERTSRFGRNLIQPLKYWANEARIYKNGQVEGIVRADHVEQPKRKKPKRRGKKAGKGVRRLEDIDEESEAESTFADEWEEDVGVISGMVANWDPETQQGVPEDLVREGIHPHSLLCFAKLWLTLAA